MSELSCRTPSWCQSRSGAGKGPRYLVSGGKTKPSHVDREKEGCLVQGAESNISWPDSTAL